MGMGEIGMGRCVEVGLLVALCLATHAFASVHHLDADNNVVPIGAAKAVDDALATDREGTGHSGAVVLQSTATAKHGAKYSAKENHQKHVAWAKGLKKSPGSTDSRGGKAESRSKGGCGQKERQSR